MEGEAVLDIKCPHFRGISCGKIINGIEQMTEGETIDRTSKIAVLPSIAGL